MKIIHCGDLHLDSKMESVLTREKAKERKNEILMTFLNMIDYARKNWVSVIIIAGDFFDTANISAKVKNTVLDAITSNPGIEFLYLKGNHDNNNFLTTIGNVPPNLKVFGDTWTKYNYEDVTICGVELNDENNTKIYDSLLLDPHRMNIVVLHGQETNSVSKDKTYSINVKEFRDKNIDYLALGHIHSYRVGTIDSRGTYCYCGCLEGRGFDECGEKGFVVLEITSGKLTQQFVPMARRTLHEVTVDVTDMTSTAAMIKKIESAVMGIKPEALVKVVLIGKVEVDCEKDTSYMEQFLLDRFYFGRVKDKTRIKINYEDYKYDTSITGEFIRLVMASPLSEEDREQIIVNGIKALSGEELD